MSSDRFSSSSHWLPTTAAPAGGGGSTAARSPQQQPLPPPPPPLMRSPGAALPSHPHTSTAPVPTSTLASTSLGADGSLPHTSPSPHTGGSVNAAAKYVDVSSMAAVRSDSGSPSGFRVVNTSSAPFPFAAQSSNAYRPPRRQSYQQQQPQASRGPAYGAAPLSTTASISGHATDNTYTSSKSVNEVSCAHVVQVPIVVGASSSSSGGGEEHFSGGAAAAAAAPSHWRGGGSGGGGRSGGRSSHSDYARRRSAGGYSDAMQETRRQPATQQRFQQQQQQQQFFGRQRGGGGHMYGQSLPLEALPEMSHPLAAEGGESHPVAAEPSTTSAATSLTHSAGGGRTGRRGSGVSSGGSVGGGALPHAAAAAVDSPFTHQHPQPQQQLVAASSAGGLPAGSHGGDGAAGTGTSPAQSTAPPLHQLQQQPISRSGVSTSSATTTTAAVTSGGSVVGARYTRPHGEERPTVALSLNVLSIYQTINEIFYQERQKLLAAPVKYAAARTYEDTAGHYVPCEGEVIADRYVFKELVGQGSFGKVLHCIDRKYNEPVAVKVIRSGPYFESQGWFEAQVVAHLNNDAALQNLVVQLRKVFLWKGHMVLVFEPLSFSLYKLITLTKHNGVSLDLTRKFAFQIVKVLLVLEQHQPPIIHCDLKPENVLLQDPSRSGVRVIDFGSACYQQQPTWRLPPAQVPLPASSPSPSAGPPWITRRRATTQVRQQQQQQQQQHPQLLWPPKQAAAATQLAKSTPLSEAAMHPLLQVTPNNSSSSSGPRLPRSHPAEMLKW